MKNIFDAIAKFYREKAVPILVSILAILIVLLIFVMILGGGNTGSSITKYQEWMIQLRNKDITICPYDCINEFFDTYYTALSEGDTTTLESLYDDAENSNATTELSTVVDSYTDITVYVTPGINSEEVLAFVSYNINFVNIESSAPAVDSFYIKTDSSTNSVYILTSMYTDSDINAFMYLASYREPIRSLLSDTEDELNSILENDDELRNIYIIMNAMSQEETTEETTQAEETSSESSSVTDTESSASEETQTDEETTSEESETSSEETQTDEDTSETSSSDDDTSETSSSEEGEDTDADTDTDETTSEETDEDAGDSGEDDEDAG